MYLMLVHYILAREILRQHMQPLPHLEKFASTFAAVGSCPLSKSIVGRSMSVNFDSSSRCCERNLCKDVDH